MKNDDRRLVADLIIFKSWKFEGLPIIIYCGTILILCLALLLVVVFESRDSAMPRFLVNLVIVWFVGMFIASAADFFDALKNRAVRFLRTTIYWLLISTIMIFNYAYSTWAGIIDEVDGIYIIVFISTFVVIRFMMHFYVKSRIPDEILEIYSRRAYLGNWYGNYKYANATVDELKNIIFEIDSRDIVGIVRDIKSDSYKEYLIKKYDLNFDPALQIYHFNKRKYKTLKGCLLAVHKFDEMAANNESIVNAEGSMDEKSVVKVKNSISNAICPSCGNKINDRDLLCKWCKADFGEYSSWKPIV